MKRYFNPGDQIKNVFGVVEYIRAGKERIIDPHP
jgi:hypothetical protein